MAFILFITIICMISWPTIESSLDQIYIVHVEGPPDATLQHPQELHSYHNSFLSSSSVAITAASSNINHTTRLIHSYRHVFPGFAATLSPDDLKELEKKKGFVSARPVRKLSLHTTRSPGFLGLNPNTGLWNNSNHGKGVIIGLLDTGISPDHPSFSPQGIPPPPPRWNGNCELFENSKHKCNNKIIGARYFGPDKSHDESTLVDENGHGTHTSSTAAGNFVKGANVFGNAYGTASGIAPHAHLAMYKVCTSNHCSDSDVLAAMDAAVEDGVDVLSLSLSQQVSHFYDDVIAIGAFRAMEKGIFVSGSAGNQGPYSQSLENEAPWFLTVGASTIDRKIIATVVLGNNQQYQGESAFQPRQFSQTSLPLVYAPNCSSTYSLNGIDIKGKMVVCDGGDIFGQGEVVKNGGGAALIVVNYEEWGNITFSDPNVLPASSIGYEDGLKIKAYMNSTATPTAHILFGGTVVGGDGRAPLVAGFSSRGPSVSSPGILKPDILGPGVNILAAWPTSVENDTRTNTKSTFNIDSGTSMACPHLSGVAALLKSAHPDWSPAAIKSAIMTTAEIVNRAHNPLEDETFSQANIFATGAGHVNPQAANYPGLIYDIKPEDYVAYLCGLGYTSNQVRLFTKEVKCSGVKSIPEAQLNYPSFSIFLIGQPTKSQTYTRTVTNVGEPYSSYSVNVVSPPGVLVCVAPKELKFSTHNQKMQYNVTFSRQSSSPNNTGVQGFFEWCSSSKLCVRSPISVILL